MHQALHDEHLGDGTAQALSPNMHALAAWPPVSQVANADVWAHQRLEAKLRDETRLGLPLGPVPVPEVLHLGREPHGGGVLGAVRATAVAVVLMQCAVGRSALSCSWKLHLINLQLIKSLAQGGAVRPVVVLPLRTRPCLSQPPLELRVRFAPLQRLHGGVSVHCAVNVLHAAHVVLLGCVEEQPLL